VEAYLQGMISALVQVCVCV